MKAMLISTALAALITITSAAEAGGPVKPPKPPKAGKAIAQSASVAFGGDLALSDPIEFEPVAELTLETGASGTVFLQASFDVHSIGTPFDPWHGTIQVRVRNATTGKAVQAQHWSSLFNQIEGNANVRQHFAITLPVMVIERPGAGVQVYILEARGAPNPSTQSAGWVVSGASAEVLEFR